MFHSSDPFWGSLGATIVSQPTNPFSTDVSTLDTLSIMATLARRDSGSPSIQSLASELMRGCTCPIEVCRSIWFWVHGHLTFLAHEDIAADVLHLDNPNDVQVLIPPSDLLQMPAPKGDCAIYSMLISALGLSLGIPVAYRVTASDSKEPERWSHVYCVVKVWEPGDLKSPEIFPIDASHGAYPGWETKTKYREMDYWL